MPDYQSDDPTLGLIIIRISDTLFCLDINYVNAILNPMEFDRENIIDIWSNTFISINDNNYPVIDFNEFFNLKNRPVTSLTRMLLLEYDDYPFAFYVDEVIEILALNIKNINEVQYADFDRNNKFVENVINYRDKSFILPAVDKIVGKFRDTLSNLPYF